jgi:6-pyruvoyltetrahydropterin/6-carboxytetrahydropterin synthase
MHGHSYKLEVEVEGVIDSSGMILDFSKLKEMVQETFLDKIDHSLLNDHFTPPTAEYMVVIMVSLLKDILKGIPDKKLSLRRLRLWETSNSYAEWRQNG